MYVSKLDIETLIHLGDYVSPFTLKNLLKVLEKSSIKFLGIFGNNDGDKVLMMKTVTNLGQLSEPPVEIEIDRMKALILHGFGPKELTDRFVNSLALSGHYELIMYGHTHTPRAEIINNALVINPGAFSGYLAESPTLALLNTEERDLAIIDIQLNTIIKKLDWSNVRIV